MPGHNGESHEARVIAGERALHNQYRILKRGELVVCFATLSVCLLISFIDQNGITVTIPNIAEELDAKATISWAGTASLIANTTFQMLYGRLSDIFGRKVVFLAAISLLVIADLLCGLAQSPAMLYIFRGVAGIGSGGITNLAMIIVSDVVTLEQRGKYLGIIGSMVGLGNVLGPLLAAAFMRTATWRAFFYMLAPLGTVVGILSYFFLPNNAPSIGFKESTKKIDYLGTFTSSLGVIFLLIPISGGGAYFDWDSPMVISMLVIGTVSFVSFIIIEWKVAKLPMMPPGIFANLPLVIMLTQTFLFGASYQSFIYYVPLYLLNARQFGVLHAASITISLVIFQAVFAILSGLYISRFKRYGEVIWLGAATWTLGAGLCLTFTRTSSPGAIVGPLIVVGIGVGLLFQPTLVAVQAHSPKSRRAVIISNRNFFRCSGGAVGLAVSAAVLQAALRARLPPEYAYLAESTYAFPSDLGTGPAAEAVRDAYMYASRAVFIMQIPLMGLVLVGCAFIRDRGLEPPDDPDSKQPNEETAQRSVLQGEVDSAGVIPEIGAEFKTGEQRGDRGRELDEVDIERQGRATT